MKWFKHMSDMSTDVKVKRIIKKYGAEGYGLYCYILERIVRNLETESPLPDLEESAMDIASDMGVDTLRVEEIMRYAIEQGLFSQDEMTGRLVAHKVYKYLQQSETSSDEIKRMISAYKTGSEPVSGLLGVSQTVIDKCEEQNRTEQNTTEKNSAVCDEVIDYLNTKSGRHYRHTESNRRGIRARLSDGYTVADCKQVVDTKVSEWQGTDMAKHLNCETLFRPSKFDKYLNQQAPKSAFTDYEKKADGTYEYKGVI